MTDSPAPAAPLADPGPPPSPPTSLPTGWDRFFAWVRGIGLSRTDGWVGGVCAGIAARIGIDPIIVRGVFVVAALFGLPMFLIYAIAWALLPDLTGRIHLQELTRRRFDPAMVGIGLMMLVGFFPVVPWFFAGVLPFGFLVPVTWFEPTPFGVLGTFLVVALIGGLVYLLVRTSRRAPTAGAPDPRTASADQEAPGSSAHVDSGVDAPADPVEASSASTGSLLAPPPAPLAPAGGDDAEIAAWREQHQAWRAHDHAWRRQQQDAERAARDRARAERAATGAAFAAEAAERRRIRKATRPRTSAAYVAFTLGLSLVAGALSSIGVGGDDPVLAVAVGLFAAALVLALSMVIAGAIRRRSGFLAFATVLVLTAGTITAAFPITRGIAFTGAYVNNFDPQSFTQLSGSLTVDVIDVGGSPAPIVIDKRGDYTSINVNQGVLLDLEVSGAESVEWVAVDASGEVVDQGRWAPTRGVVAQTIDTRADGESGTRQSVTVRQTDGIPYVTIYESPED